MRKKKVALWNSPHSDNMDKTKNITGEQMRVSEQDAEQLRILEESLWRAETRFDLDYMESILAPDFFEFGRSGRIYTRQETLAIESQNLCAKLKNFQAHWVDDNVVLTTYISKVVYDEVQLGNRSSLWVKTDEGWQLRFHQGTKITE